MTALCKFTWVIEGKLFHVNWPNTIDDDVMEAFRKDIFNFLEDSTMEKAHYIADMYAVGNLPPLNRVKENAAFLNHKNMGWAIALAANNRGLKMLVQVVIRLFPIQVRFVNTVDDALDFLQNADPTLPDLTPYRDIILGLGSNNKP